MDYFCKHENHDWSPSLASNGIKHQTKQSDLMECLESLAPQPDNIPDVMLVLLMVPPLCIYLTQRNRIIQSKLSSTTDQLRFYHTENLYYRAKGCACEYSLGCMQSG